MNLIRELGTLSMTQPRHDADQERAAAWYRAKAHMHEELARQGGADSDHHNALAAAALEKALHLLRPYPAQKDRSAR